MFLQSGPRPSIKTVALSFLNDMTYREMMLNGGKDIELRPHRRGDAARHRHYTHVIFRMVKRLREKKSLCKVGAHMNIVAKLDNVLGPYYNATDVLEAAEKAGRKIGMSKGELETYMTGWRKINGGPKKGGYLVQVIRPMVLHELSGIQVTDEFFVNDCSHNQAGFLPNSFKDKSSGLRVTHFDYNEICTDSDPIGCGAAVTAVALTAPLPLPVDAGVPCSAMPVVTSQSKSRQRAVTAGFNGFFRLGKLTCAAADATCASIRHAAATTRIPRKQRSGSLAYPIVIE